MRRALVTACLLAVLATAAGAHGATGSATLTTTTTPTTPTTTTPTTTTPVTPPGPPALRASLELCQAGQLATDRVAVFTGSMPMVKGATQLRMRFELLTRPSRLRPWRALVVPKWGIWQRSAAGVPGFVYSKRIAGLLAPAQYRAVVTFRWYDDAGQLVRTQTRQSPVCNQPDLRSDLTLTKVSATPTPDGGASYQLTLLNRGNGPAGPFDVAMSIDDADQDAVAVDALAVDTSRVVTILAPRCTDVLRIWLDPANVVPEIHEHRSAIVRPCPLS